MTHKRLVASTVSVGAVAVVLFAAACSAGGKGTDLPKVTDVTGVADVDTEWESSVEFEGNSAIAAVAAKGVIVISGDSGEQSLAVLDRSNGDELWNLEKFSGHAFVTDEALVVGTLPFEEVKVYDLKSGKLRFSHEAISKGKSPAAVVDEYLIVADADDKGTKYTAGYSLETGDEVWRNEASETTWVAATAESETGVKPSGSTRWVHRATDSPVVFTTLGPMAAPQSSAWIDASTGKEVAALDKPAPVSRMFVSSYVPQGNSAAYHLGITVDGDKCSYRSSSIDVKSKDVTSATLDADRLRSDSVDECPADPSTEPLPEIFGQLLPAAEPAKGGKPQWIDLTTGKRAWTGRQNGMPQAVRGESVVYSESTDGESQGTVLAAADPPGKSVTWRTDLSPLNKKATVEAADATKDEVVVQFGEDAVVLAADSGEGKWMLTNSVLLAHDKSGYVFVQPGGDKNVAKVSMVSR